MLVLMVTQFVCPFSSVTMLFTLTMIIETWHSQFSRLHAWVTVIIGRLRRETHVARWDEDDVDAQRASAMELAILPTQGLRHERPQTAPGRMNPSNSKSSSSSRLYKQKTLKSSPEFRKLSAVALEQITGINQIFSIGP